jgi:hypothetical protein
VTLDTYSHVLVDDREVNREAVLALGAALGLGRPGR